MQYGQGQPRTLRRRIDIIAGTNTGGKKTAETNKKKYGPDFYANIGRKGGAKGKKDGAIKGFAAMTTEKAAAAGRKGGTISRRGAARQSEVNRQYLALPDSQAAKNESEDERTEVAHRYAEKVMAYEQPKRKYFLDRFKKAKA